MENRDLTPARARQPTKKILNSGYSEGGASLSRDILKTWLPLKFSAKSDIDANIATLRNRSADMAINTPIGAAAISTSALHTIGAGLKVRPHVAYQVLEITPDEAREWGRKVKREFDLWASSKYCDIYKRNNFYDLQDLAYTAYLIDGDAFAVFRRKPPTAYMPYSLRLQILEGNRVSNPHAATVYSPFYVEAKAPNGNRIINGVEIDGDGAVKAFWICNKVPNDFADMSKIAEWTRVEAFGEVTGMPNIVQICHDVRAEQYRGVPYLAPVIETLKQVSRYTSAELTAAIVKSFFALFFTETPTISKSFQDVLPSAYDEPQEQPEYDEDGVLIRPPVVNPKNYGIGAGTLAALPQGVDVKSVDVNRSMSTFDAFTSHLVKQIGAAIGQPYEVLMKSFMSSYSASRAALLQAWEEYKLRRMWFSRDFCQPVYESWLAEAIAIGRINAPGFFADPLIRAAWCKADWYGPTMSILDPVKDINGANLRVQLGISTREKEAAELTGTDLEENLDQLEFEQRMIEDKHLNGSLPAVLAGQETTEEVKENEQ